MEIPDISSWPVAAEETVRGGECTTGRVTDVDVPVGTGTGTVHPFELNVAGVQPVEDIIQRDPGMAAILQELAAKPRASGTVKNYAVEIRRYRKFCDKAGYVADEPTEQTMIHFIGDLAKSKVSLATLLQVQPAIEMFLKMISRTGVWTDKVRLFFDGATRKAAGVRQQVRKAPEVSRDMLREIVARYVDATADEGPAANPLKLRTIARIVVIYFTLCRGADYMELQARHVELHGQDLVITFPKTKNDQLHNGHLRVLTKRDGGLCGPTVLAAYMRRIGLTMGAAANDTRPLHCRIRKTASGWMATAAKASASKAREELQDILSSMGWDKKAATDKSFKMLGVTEMLRAGMSVEEVANHGGWKTTDIVRRYQHNSLEYKRDTAAKVPA